LDVRAVRLTHAHACNSRVQFWISRSWFRLMTCLVAFSYKLPSETATEAIDFGCLTVRIYRSFVLQPRTQ
jgi:hypothetical protein